MLGEYYGTVQGGELHAQLHQKLGNAVAVAMKKTRGRMAAFRQQIDSSQQGDAVQREADMITANLYRIKPGMEQVCVPAGAVWRGVSQLV